MSKMQKRFSRTGGAVLALSALVPAGVAMAQSADAQQAQAGQLETVTVTAQRRTENIRDVPVSVSSLKDEKLDVILSGGQDIRVLAGK
eukprot:gene35117-39721_t